MIYIQRKKKTLIMRRAAAAVPLFIGDRHQHISYWFPVAKRAAVVEKFPNLVLQLSLYYRMYCMHCGCIIKPYAAKEIYWPTHWKSKREAEERRRWGELTVTAHPHLSFVMGRDSELPRWFASLQNENLFTIVYQTLTLAFMATGFQTVKPAIRW